jgi:MFS superfamily sulfate permease-like transporter
MEPGCLTVLRGFSAKEFMYSSFAFYKTHPSALRKEILSGITLALIEVPESIAFAFMAGLGPSFGMASVVWMGTLTGFFGGRPAMISGAAGAMAVVMGNLTREDGPLRDFTREERVEHLMMCILLIGALEFLCGPFLCAFVKIIPQSAMIGFMNALALILFIG